MLRLAGPGLPPSERGLALSTDSNPTWCSIDPRLGTASTVAETSLNLACAGAAPAAIVNCLNFGNPEHPEVMWQLSEAIDGLAEACLALGLPVIGGNVSFYNESAGADIDPTPVIGGLGLIERLVAPPPGVALSEGASLVLLDAGVGASAPSLAGSRWAVRIRGHRNGTLPPLDLARHAQLVEFVARSVGAGVAGRDTLVTGIHDVSAGGIGVTLAEFAVRTGIGLEVGGIADHRALFTEAPSRVVVCTTSADQLCSQAADAGHRRRRCSGPRVVTGSWSTVCSTYRSPTRSTRGVRSCPTCSTSSRRLRPSDRLQPSERGLFRGAQVLGPGCPIGGTDPGLTKPLGSSLHVASGGGQEMSRPVRVGRNFGRRGDAADL